MKKILMCAILLIMACVLCWSALAASITGGWKIIPHGAAELPEDAQTAFNKAVEQLDGADYTPVALLGTQIVAGTNYCILCAIAPVVPNPETHYALVYIYADLEGGAAITNVADLDIPGLWAPAKQ